MAVVLILVLVVVGSVLFHVLSPWWWTPIASNWSYIDSTLVITFWEDEAALEASMEAGDQLAELTAENTGAKRLAIELYEATLFDV